MAGKRSAKNTLKETIALSVSAQQFYGYADYYNRVPLFTSLQLTNAGAEAAEGLEVVIEGAEGFLLPFSGLRQGIAIGVCCLAAQYIQRKKIPTFQS